MIVFQDVDGCLNTPDGAALDISTNILTEQQEVALRDLGRHLDNSAIDHCVINTGRSWAATKFICDAINSRKLNYALTEHGSELWDVNSNIALDLSQISSQLGFHDIRAALKSVERIRELITWFHATGNSMVSSDVGHTKLIDCLHDKTSNLTLVVPKELDGDALVSSLRSFIENESQFKEANFVYHHGRADGFIDVMGQMDKGLGVQVMTRYLSGDPANTFAIGDGLNDLPMLKAVNTPICPANAVLEVQALCSEKGHKSDAHYIGAVTGWLSHKAGR